MDLSPSRTSVVDRNELGTEPRPPTLTLPETRRRDEGSGVTSPSHTDGKERPKDLLRTVSFLERSGPLLILSQWVP